MRKFIRESLYRMKLGVLYKLASTAKQDVVAFMDRVKIRYGYNRIIKRIRQYPASRKIKVYFQVIDTAKWKAQSLYEALAKSNDFEPYMALTIDEPGVVYYGDRLAEKFEEDEKFYRRLGNRCVRIFDIGTMRPMRYSDLGADVVFFQDPRDFYYEDSVRTTAATALCCYVPYGIMPVGEIRWYMIQPEFHQLMFLQFTLNDVHSKFLRDALPNWRWAGDFAAVGHPFLDEFTASQENISNSDGFVIYAPHFSFPKDGRIITLSSFLKNGREILAYAQKHREFKWLFKPHPLLYKALVEEKGWGKDAADKYFCAWEALGESCYSGDYVRLFKHSRALITDCGSFLSEYPLTGNPLIRLVPKELDFPVFWMFNKLFDTFYTVHNLDEMYATFEQVLERGKDPKRFERMKAAKELGLIDDITAADKIILRLKEACGR